MRPITHTTSPPGRKKAVHSRRDTTGKILVDCSECDYGGNGFQTEKCSCGWNRTGPDTGGCFFGVLIDDLYLPPNT